MSIIRALIRILDRLNDLLVNILKYVLGAALCVQIVLIFMTAVMRYVFNRPLSWSDEMTTYLLVMITFLGGYVAANHGALAKVELVSGMFRGNLKKIVDLIAHVLSAGLVGWIAFYGTKLFFSPVIQNQTSSAMRIPVSWVWWSLPVTMWLLLFTELLQIVHIFIPKEGVPEEAAEEKGGSAA